MKLTKSLLVALAAGAVFVNQSKAVPLPLAPSPAPPTPLTPGVVAGPSLASMLDPFSNALYSGVVESWVYADPAWPIGLTFVYQVRLDPNTGPSLDEVHRLTTFGWAGVLPFVEQEIVGVPGINATLDGGGNAIGFNFGSPSLFVEGMSSARLIVRSTAPAWTAGIGAVIDGQSSNVDVLVPSLAVPDGGITALFLSLSFFGLAASRKLHG